jgi:hypothetical protein
MTDASSSLNSEFDFIATLYEESYTKWCETHTLGMNTLVSLSMMTVGFIERMKNQALIRENGKKETALALMRFVIRRHMTLDATQSQQLDDVLDMIGLYVPSIIDGLVSAANGELWARCSPMVPDCLASLCQKRPRPSAT